MSNIKTTKEELQDKKLLSIKNAMSEDTSNVVPVDLLQKQISFLALKLDELVKEVNNIKDALVYGDEHD
tara:strand:- start:1563 stop:1769 length:207 start_codon:yes stop_codon:yes gene_type:complete